MSSRERNGLLGLAALVVIGPLLLAMGGTLEIIGFLSPLLALLAPLLCGRYVGERAIHRVRGVLSRPRRRRARSSRRSHRAPRAVLARGGALIATSLAVRPPPAVLTNF